MSSSIKNLSPRQREIMAHFSSGLTIKEVADKLGLSHSTVGTHMKSAMVKLGVKKISHATSLFAVETAEDRIAILESLFLGPNSPAVQWFKASCRQPFQPQLVVMLTGNSPSKGFYRNGCWYNEHHQIVEPPEWWADASLNNH